MGPSAQFISAQQEVGALLLLHYLTLYKPEIGALAFNVLGFN